MAPDKILLATDYSEESQHALSVATSLARAAGASLLIVHVSPYEPYPVGELFDEEPRPSPIDTEPLEQVVPLDPDVPYEHRLVHGEPAEQIVNLARDENVGTIVMGTRGATGLTHLIAGSVAEAVIRQAPCPVVAVRRPVPAEPQLAAVGDDYRI
jgi:nucleotide-binding universal stress UspA family protein